MRYNTIRLSRCAIKSCKFTVDSTNCFVHIRSSRVRGIASRITPGRPGTFERHSPRSLRSTRIVSRIEGHPEQVELSSRLHRSLFRPGFLAESKAIQVDLHADHIHVCQPRSSDKYLDKNDTEAGSSRIQLTLSRLSRPSPSEQNKYIYIYIHTRKNTSQGGRVFLYENKNKTQARKN